VEEKSGQNEKRGTGGPPVSADNEDPAEAPDMQAKLATIAAITDDAIFAKSVESVENAARKTDSIFPFRIKVLLDAGKAAPKAGTEAYKLGAQLCNNLLAALDARDQALVRAGYRAAQADANTKVTSQALEARRNYMMSWPQYAREKDQRGEIQRQQTNGATLVKESVKVEWSNKSAALRKSLDAQYAKYRDALRQGAK